MKVVKKIKVDEERLQRREEGEKMVVRFVGRSRREVAEGECVCVRVCSIADANTNCCYAFYRARAHGGMGEGITTMS